MQGEMAGRFASLQNEMSWRFAALQGGSGPENGKYLQMGLQCVMLTISKEKEHCRMHR